MSSAPNTIKDLMISFKSKMNSYRLKHIEKLLKLSSPKSRGAFRSKGQLRQTQQSIVVEANALKHIVCSLEDKLVDIEEAHQAELAKQHHANQQLLRTQQMMQLKIKDLNAEIITLKERLMAAMKINVKSQSSLCPKNDDENSDILDDYFEENEEEFSVEKDENIDDQDTVGFSHEDEEDSEDSYEDPSTLLPQNDLEETHLNELERFNRSQEEEFVISSDEEESE